MKASWDFIGTSTQYQLPWEPTTFIFGSYNPYIGGVKPSNFMVLGSKGFYYPEIVSVSGLVLKTFTFVNDALESYTEIGG